MPTKLFSSMRFPLLLLRFGFVGCVIIGLPLLAVPSNLAWLEQQLGGVPDDASWTTGETGGAASLAEAPRHSAIADHGGASKTAIRASQLVGNPPGNTDSTFVAAEHHFAAPSRGDVATPDSPSQASLPDLDNDNENGVAATQLDYHQTVQQLVRRGAMGCSLVPVGAHAVGPHGAVAGGYRFRCLMRLPDSVYYRVYSAERSEPAAAAAAVLAQVAETGGVQMTTEYQPVYREPRQNPNAVTETGE